MSKVRTSASLTSWLQSRWQSVVSGIPFIWLLLFFLAPFFIVLKISLAESIIASPPFTKLLNWDGGLPSLTASIDNFAYLWEDSLYVRTYINSIKIAFISTVLCLLIGYPMAWAIVRSQGTTRYILLLLIILPFWTSFLLRVYAWMGLLADQGTLNSFLIWLGVIEKPIRLLYSQFVRRYCVFLPAVYDSATVRQYGKARHLPAGGSRRPWSQTTGRIFYSHSATDSARHTGRLTAGLYSRHRRVRHSGFAGWW